VETRNWKNHLQNRRSQIHDIKVREAKKVSKRRTRSKTPIYCDGRGKRLNGRKSKRDPITKKEERAAKRYSKILKRTTQKESSSLEKKGEAKLGTSRKKKKTSRPDNA